MNADHNSNDLERLIRTAIGGDRLSFDFRRWKQEHPQSIEEFRSQQQPFLSPPGRSVSQYIRLHRGPAAGLIAAAAIIVVALILISLFTGSLDGATAYAKVAKAVRNAPWMHIRYTGYLLDEKGNKKSKEGELDNEVWYSFSAQTVIRKYHGGHIVYTDYGKRQVYTYNPRSHRIILTGLGKYRRPFTSDSPWSWLEGTIRTITTPGGNVTRRTEQYQGQQVEVLEIVSAVEPRVAAIRDKIFVDRTTFLPIAEERTFINTNTGMPQQIDTGTFDYPQQGPADIYALGLSRDIPIINSLPLPEWHEISIAYQSHHRQAPFPRYIAVVTEKMTIRNNPVRAVEICYADGSRFRRERHFPLGQGLVADQWAQQAPELGTTFDSILKWARAYKANGPISITLFDRNHYYDCRRDEDGVWSRTEQTFDDQGRTHYDFWNLCPVAKLGWPEIRSQADIIQDDYARENNLIRVEAPQGTFWLNPQRDYLCQRRLLTNGRMEEITEVGQTDEGRWYPRQIEDGVGLYTIHLDTNSEFPERIFDPNRLPRTEE
jgi:hypothetical protein